MASNATAASATNATAHAAANVTVTTTPSAKTAPAHDKDAPTNAAKSGAPL